MLVSKTTVFIVLTHLFILAGCSTVAREDNAQITKQQLLKEGKTLDFIDGYLSGCSAGKKVIYQKLSVIAKDQLRYQQNHEYNTGWDRGYYSCRDASIVEVQAKVTQKYVPADDLAEEMERMKIWEELKK